MVPSAELSPGNAPPGAVASPGRIELLREVPPLNVDLRAQLQKTLGDDYRQKRELGGGGMSRVFEAEDVRHNERPSLPHHAVR